MEKKIIKKGVEKITTTPKKAVAAVWTCPMHPEVKSDKPGKCPKCGMTLIPVMETPAEKSGRQERGSVERESVTNIGAASEARQP